MRRVCRLGGYKHADLTHAAMSSYGRELKRRVCRLGDFTHADSKKIIEKRTRVPYDNDTHSMR